MDETTRVQIQNILWMMETKLKQAKMSLDHYDYDDIRANLQNLLGDYCGPKRSD